MLQTTMKQFGKRLCMFLSFKFELFLPKVGSYSFRLFMIEVHFFNNTLLEVFDVLRSWNLKFLVLS